MTGGSEPLHPDLVPYLDEDSDQPVLHHRFIIDIGVDPVRYEAINGLYRQKLAYARKAFRNQDWVKYVFLHERPYRLSALRRCFRSGLIGEGYWHLVAQVWIDSENIHQYGKQWRALWSADTTGRNQAMTTGEQQAHANLPDETTVWRGTAYRDSIQGLSWTTDRAKAEWFARRSLDRYRGKGPALLVTGTVRREDVFAVIFQRKENEVVCRKVTVTDVQEL